MSEEIVKNIVQGNNVEAQNAFNSVMTDKVGQALEAERKVIAKSFVKPKEEVSDETD